MKQTADSFDISTSLYELVPESTLLAPLADNVRKRFEMALQLMHSTLSDRLTWEQIASRSAISPFHFHRQFTQLFHETPGQYLHRIRLQYAISQLLMSQNSSITQIALSSGYSSSQALAKALKRETGYQAKQIKALGQTGTPDQTIALLRKLAHPSQHRTSEVVQPPIEQQLASSMPCELIWFPARGIYTQTAHRGDWHRLFDHHGQQTARMLCATPVLELDRPWHDMTSVTGKWRTPPEQSDQVISEGYYLCAKVRVASDIAYLNALESLFRQAEWLGYDLDNNGSLIEILLDMDTRFTGTAGFHFQIPVQLAHMQDE
ncbi:helix-turn-helix domain-containing protein [Photobacterium halotolerans]|uniref:helix-turn-helix transcriptional regulator n=1 Tax=Photobacterium halotolerans TaxID=265726 RepID=UPI0013734B03|nr:helix-turn-helix domain-containing protein [Photobacterium halotolerans]NAX48097.1 helix-turn-helix domain-containing protein [Photobacterium halotolerans]